MENNDMHAPRLGEVVGLVRGTTYKSALLGQPGPVLLGLGSIQRNGGFREGSLKTYGGDSPSKLLLAPGDLYVSLKDVTQSADLLGAIARVPDSIESGRLTQDTVKLDFGNNQYPRDLLYWALRAPEYRAYCRGHATGTTNLGLPRDDFLAYRLPAPTDRLLALVEALDALDGKIEVNNKINANLEAQAQAIFKSWFVDFEPFKDGEFVDSELGPIPKGWKVHSLSDIAQFLNGLAMQKFRPNDGGVGIPVLKIKELRQGYCDSTSERCSEDIKSEYLIDNGDIVFSWSGSLLVDIWCGGICGLNQHLFKVASDRFDKWFCYLWTKHHLDEFIAIAAGKATTMGHIRRGDLDAALVCIPNAKVYRDANELIAPIIEMIVTNRIQNRTLKSIRDSLLPKLMSG